MAYTFPLSEAQFADRLRQNQHSFFLPDARTRDETVSGETLWSRRGHRLWRGQIVIAREDAIRMEPVRGLIDMLCEPGASFLIGDAARRYPAGDPDGSILGAASVVVQDAPLDRRLVVLEGAPAGYALSEGDHLSIAFGSGARSYHRVMQGGAFSGGFTPARTGTLQLHPLLPAGVSAGDAVQLVRPLLKAEILQDSVNGGGRVRPMKAQPVTFDWIQTLG